jgi:hypothetical protein
MRFAARDHLDKSAPYVRALVAAGHEQVPLGAAAEVLLIDLDAPEMGFRDTIAAYRKIGAAVVMYPHGAGQMPLHWDAMWEPVEDIDLTLVIAPGYAEFLRRIEYPCPVAVSGWAYTGIAPFRPARDVRRVLFAPTHPSGRGTLSDPQREVNVRSFEQLLDGPWELTVRHIGTIEQNGLWAAPGVRFVQGGMDQSHAEIDEADVVVAGEGTFPALAIARGTPTVLCGQLDRPLYGRPGEEPSELWRADRYAEYVRYPFDLEDGPADEILHAAARSEAPVAEFKRRFIGDPLDIDAVARLVEGAVERRGTEPGPWLDDTRAVTFAAFADELREHPDLLASYSACVGPDAPATLAVWAPGRSPEDALAVVSEAVARAGIADDALPDVLVVAPRGVAIRDIDAMLASRAQAVLTRWPAAGRLGELPQVDADQLADVALPALRQASQPGCA